MGLFFMIIFFIINLASITWIRRIVRFKKCLPPFGPPAYHHYLSSSCQTFISEGQLLCSDPSFVRFLSFPFTHDSHTQEPKVFVSIVFLSRIFVCCGFHHIFTRLFAYRRTSFKACKEFLHCLYVSTVSLLFLFLLFINKKLFHILLMIRNCWIFLFMLL